MNGKPLYKTVYVIDPATPTEIDALANAETGYVPFGPPQIFLTPSGDINIIVQTMVLNFLGRLF